jgi:low affinity Fe/Cu permease
MAFVLAALAIVVRLAIGPWYAFQRHRRPVIVTGTTIVTFLMVVPSQNTQNRARVRPITRPRAAPAAARR